MTDKKKMAVLIPEMMNELSSQSGCGPNVAHMEEMVDFAIRQINDHEQNASGNSQDVGQDNSLRIVEEK